jgi:hypothetical protein
MEYWIDACCASYPWQILRTYNTYRKFEVTANILGSCLLACFNQFNYTINYECFTYLMNTFKDLVPFIPQTYSIFNRFVCMRTKLSTKDIELCKVFVATIKANKEHIQVESFIGIMRSFEFHNAACVELFKYMFSTEFAQLFSDYRTTDSVRVHDELFYNIVFCVYHTTHHLEALKHLMNALERHVLQKRLVATLNRFIFSRRYVHNLDWHRLQIWKTVERELCKTFGVQSLVEVQEQIHNIQVNIINYSDDFVPPHLNPFVDSLYQYFKFMGNHFDQVSEAIDCSTALPCDVINCIILSY